MKKQLEVYDGLNVDYDYSEHYINSNIWFFNFDCIDRLYYTIDSTYVVECLDVFPNGILQAEKYSLLFDYGMQKQQAASGGSATITYSFENAGTVSTADDDFFEFDIYVASSIPAYFDNGLMRISYNPAAFGNALVANDRVTIQRGEILGSISDFLEPMPVDADGGQNAIYIAANASFNALNRHPINSTPSQLIHVKIKITDCLEVPELQFINLSTMLFFSILIREDLPSGFYSLRVAFGDVVFNYKVIKQ